jgi:hypothetical protein
MRLLLAMARQPEALRDAKSAFLAGQAPTALELLNSLERVDSRGLVLASRMALFASRFEEAEELANQASWSLPCWSRYAKQAFYLRQEALRKLGRHQQARALFSPRPFKDSSNRFYQALRLAVDSTEHLSFYEAHCRDLPLYGASWRSASANYLLLLRNLGQTEQAIALAKIRHQQLTGFFKFGQLRSRQKAGAKSKAQWMAKAAQALQDLDCHFREHGVELFLISGTLLGCVREGTILGHDKDIDVGVSDEHSKEDLQAIMQSCPTLKEREIESTNAIYLEHANSVYIDVFIHYKKDGATVAHGGLKAEWVNTPFKVKQIEFLGNHYGVPANTDLYLEENYGNWQTPKPGFETFTDTPNMIITNKGAFGSTKSWQLQATTCQGTTTDSKVYKGLNKPITKKPVLN